MGAIYRIIGGVMMNESDRTREYDDYLMASEGEYQVFRMDRKSSHYACRRPVYFDVVLPDE